MLLYVLAQIVHSVLVIYAQLYVQILGLGDLDEPVVPEGQERVVHGQPNTLRPVWPPVVDALLSVEQLPYLLQLPRFDREGVRFDCVDVDGFLREQPPAVVEVAVVVLRQQLVDVSK